jgi:phosphoadenosine phosphosulfate reductase
MELIEKERFLGAGIDHKIQKSQAVIQQAFDLYGLDNMALAVTGGKDSTTNLWLFKQVCAARMYRLPLCMFIDEGDVFDESREFMTSIQARWSLEVVYVKNDDPILKDAAVGEVIHVSSLNQVNQAALEEMGFAGSESPFIPDSTLCNHLMRTTPMREFIRENKIKALATAIRWDEVGARVDEDYFSDRSNPRHTRVHPMLHFTERDVWIAIFKHDIPHNKLYKLGYRSLGARCATRKTSDIPAWMQDLENTPERVGRGQDKEAVMDQLRALGYM